ncbi:MAG TPA: NAD(P)-dependent oxidoreductase [Rhizomicrobium sp.]|nr:NAD(P)-dependent oxidoreductase [Rhizomicrobium sp.]
MLPIVLNPKFIRAGIAGEGEGLTKRRALLTEAGASSVTISRNADPATLRGLHVLFVAGLPRPIATKLADTARRAGVLVNVEDIPDLCDFHVPAVVRQGDLLLTVSTGGTAPGLSRSIREWLQKQFGPEWRARAAQVGKARDGWRKKGMEPSEVSQRTREMLTEKGWLS